VSPILGIIASQDYVRITGSYDSIATQTVGAGGAASVTFSSIPSTYKHLQIRGISRCTKADTGSENVVMSFNSDTTYTNYYTHIMDGDGSSAYATGIQVSGFYSQAALTIGNNATANAYGAAVIDILDYTNTSKNTTVRILTGIDTNGYGQVRLASSVWMSTAAIDSITINPRSAGNFLQYSSFALYGIRG
jgi:hypothetical protein